MKQIITACVCTCNRHNLLLEAIKSLMRQNLDKRLYRILIVDNSPDREKAYDLKMKLHNPPFLLYIIEKKTGLSNARNVGVRECGTEFIAFIDDDAIASPDWLNNILFGFKKFGLEVAAIGGRVKPVWEVTPPSWLDESLVSYLSIIDLGDRCRFINDDEWLAGTNIAFRTENIIDIGLFDTNLGRVGNEAILLSNEEINLLKRLRNAGKKIAYIPNAIVYHYISRDRLTREWFRRRAFWQALSDYLSDTSGAMERLNNNWSWALEYFHRISSEYKSIEALYLSLDDPELFRHQIDAIYCLTLALIFGFVYDKGDANL